MPALVNRQYTNKCAHNISDQLKQNKYTKITEFPCLIFKDIKVWITHKKDHLKNNS